MNSSLLMSEAKYETWRKKLPVLYDIFVRDNLTSPSLTVQWLPSLEKRRGRTPKRISKLKLKQRLVLGSYNTDEDSHLNIATILFSEKRLKTHLDRMQSNPNPATCFIKIGTKIKHPGVVNRARYMPQNPAFLATKSSNGDVYIYDMRKICSEGKETCDPELKLKGLTAGGSGISWNPNRKGYIVSCSINERTIRLWDVNSKSIKDGVDNSLNKFNRGHPFGVNDCSWHSLHSSLFGSAGNDRNIHIWDIRADFTKMPAVTGTGHKSSVNSLSFNCFSDHLLATGSSDQTIALWDLRKMRSPCHRISWHKTEIRQLHWSPNNESILASSGVDDRVLVWDISEIGAHQTLEDAEEAPPELLFIHGGHTDNVLDFSWNLTEPWLLCSVSRDNVIQVWQMGQHIYDNNNAKKKSRLKPSKPKESSKCPIVPGPSSSFLKPSFQTNSDTPSFESPTFSGAFKPANLMEASQSSHCSISPRSSILPTCPSSKAKQPTVETFKPEEASDHLDKPEQSEDLTPELQIFSDLPLPASPLIDDLEILLKPLPCLSPLSVSSLENSPPSVSSSDLPTLQSSMDLSKPSISYLSPMSRSSLEDSLQSFESTQSPKLPTLIESPNSLEEELPSSPESIKSSVSSSSDPPTPPESAKSILLPLSVNSEKCPKPLETSLNAKHQGKQETGGLTHPYKSESSTQDSQRCLPTTNEFPTCHQHLIGSKTEQNPATLGMPSTQYWYTCEGYHYDPQCEICFYLRKLSEDDQSSSVHHQEQPISSSPSHLFSPESPATVDYLTFSGTQNPTGNHLSADIKIPDPSIHSDDLVTDFQIPEAGIAIQDFQTLAGCVTRFSDTQDFPILDENNVSADIQNTLNRNVTPYIKEMGDTIHYLHEPIFLNFEAPPASPAFQYNMTSQDVAVFTEDISNINQSQDDPTSTINIINTPNIQSSHDSVQTQKISKSRDVMVISEVPPNPNLLKTQNELECVDILNIPDGSLIQDDQVSSGKTT